MALYGPLLYAWLPLLVFFLQAFHGGSAHSSCSQNNGGCDQNALCSDDPTTGTTKCTCKTGYTNTGCDDNVVCADSCTVNHGDCHSNADCLHDATTNAVQCICNTGYTNTGSGSNVVCKGMMISSTMKAFPRNVYLSDSCTVNNGACHPNAFCSHDAKKNAVKCTCKVGYTNTGSADNVVCAGMIISRKVQTFTQHHCLSDRCPADHEPADPNAICSPDADKDGRKCTCKAGYTNIGSDRHVVCRGTMTSNKTDAFPPHLYTSDSCKVSNGACDRNAVCSHDAKTNAVVCTCKAGYTNTGSGSKVVCTGMMISHGIKKIRPHPYISDSCTVRNGACGRNAVCSHHAKTNAVVCTCKAGYTNTGSGSKVVCTDSCTFRNGACDRNAVCSHDAKTNAVVCTCKTGYTNTGSGSSVVCTDSCTVSNGACDENAVCSHDAKTNAVVCTCKTGYTNTGSGSKVVCTDSSSESNEACGRHAVRSRDAKTNAVVCTCKAGYSNTGSGSKVVCTDSCTVSNGACDENAVCSHDAKTNAVVCTCKTGYTNTGSGSEVVCTDSCTVNNGGCDPNAACSHDGTTYAVICACKTGYTNTGSGSKVVCTDSCTVNNGACDENAVCSHDAKTNAVVCTCKTGYTNTGSGSKLIHQLKYMWKESNCVSYTPQHCCPFDFDKAPL
ncbi:unnamed protein product [Rotaria socialis]